MKRSFLISGIATSVSFILYFSFLFVNPYFNFGSSFYYLDILQLVFLPQDVGGISLLFNNLAVPWGVLLAIAFAVLFAFTIDLYRSADSSTRADSNNVRGLLLRFLMYLWMVILWGSLLMTLYWFGLLFWGESLVASGDAIVPVFMLIFASPLLFGLSFLLFLTWYITRKLKTVNISTTPFILLTQRQVSDIPTVSKLSNQKRKILLGSVTIILLLLFLVGGYGVWNTKNNPSPELQLSQYKKIALLTERMSTELQSINNLINQGELIAPNKEALYWVLNGNSIYTINNKPEWVITSNPTVVYSSLPGAYCSTNISVHTEGLSEATGAQYYMHTDYYNREGVLVSLQEFNNYLVQNGAYCVNAALVSINSPTFDEDNSILVLVWEDSVSEDMIVWSRE